MEIVIQSKGIVYLEDGFIKHNFEIFSTDKLLPLQYLTLAKTIFNGNSHSHEEFGINKDTSLPHKYLYRISITNDISS